ncbi:magnesium/cobalt transporter CorA [Parachitinimonas caeni]|uniref:Magnesium transport protein CorA n=1 Tax=Parachitinimonas caeni TaxID=3031301 RepID=A0ABT7DRY7_9NEIS|nr:magnesium/cobalt transporter CorA [Parachitinimonas caeni]MDK2122835.1 magnesium/cobalt transporter CorA [Parachitinimonas caeni]
MSRNKHRLVGHNSKKAGLPPGSLVHVGEIKTSEPLATLIEYGHDGYRETCFTSLEQGRGFQPQHPNLWLNIHGLHNIPLLEEVGRRFGLHPLVLEDILNTGQRPKVDVYDGYSYIVARLIHFDNDRRCLSSEQISIVLGRNFVLTFQEKPTGTFTELRERLKVGGTQVASSGPDYLVYSLLDKVIDRYFKVVEDIGEEIELLEDEVSVKAQTSVLTRIHSLRQEMLGLKRALWPMREVLNTLQRDEPDLFSKETQLYLRDVYDHTIHLIESLETLRDLIAGLLDIFMSAQGHRLNLEMRFLTVITTIFMPLTLISSIYGMNFEFMPELHWRWGYFGVLALMAFLAAAMGIFFWRKKWLR